MQLLLSVMGRHQLHVHKIATNSIGHRRHGPLRDQRFKRLSSFMGHPPRAIRRN